MKSKEQGQQGACRCPLNVHRLGHWPAGRAAVLEDKECIAIMLKRADRVQATAN